MHSEKDTVIFIPTEVHLATVSLLVSKEHSLHKRNSPVLCVQQKPYIVQGLENGTLTQ